LTISVSSRPATSRGELALAADWVSPISTSSGPSRRTSRLRLSPLVKSVLPATRAPAEQASDAAASSSRAKISRRDRPRTCGRQARGDPSASTSRIHPTVLPGADMTSVSRARCRPYNVAATSAGIRSLSVSVNPRVAQNPALTSMSTQPTTAFVRLRRPAGTARQYRYRPPKSVVRCALARRFSRAEGWSSAWLRIAALHLFTATVPGGPISAHLPSDIARLHYCQAFWSRRTSAMCSPDYCRRQSLRFAGSDRVVRRLTVDSFRSRRRVRHQPRHPKADPPLPTRGDPASGPPCRRR
jgi:hypothetical protein